MAQQAISDFRRAGQFGEDDQFCFAFSDHLQNLLVPWHILSTFHNKLEPGIHQLQQLFRLFGHHLPALGAAQPCT